MVLLFSRKKQAAESIDLYTKALVVSIYNKYSWMFKSHGKVRKYAVQSLESLITSTLVQVASNSQTYIDSVEAEYQTLIGDN